MLVKDLTRGLRVTPGWRCRKQTEFMRQYEIRPSEDIHGSVREFTFASMYICQPPYGVRCTVE